MADPSSSSSQPEEDPQTRDDSNILSQHLDPQFTASLQEEAAVIPDDYLEATNDALFSEPQSSLKLQGGDVHRDLYRLEAKTKQARMGKRAATFSFLPRRQQDVIEEGVAALEPGSFRRHFIRNKHGQLDHPAITVTFLDFLDLYGNFAGEDLEETEEESLAVEEEEEEEEEEAQLEAERRPLLGARKRQRAARPGDASNVKSFFTLLKAFVGTGIIFLPKAFRNGGILFSSITLVSIGFVCACIIFTAENVRAFLLAVLPSTINSLTTGRLIVLQLLVLVPLALIRNISKLGPVALLADVFILFGLGYIYCYDIARLATQGVAPTVKLFNPQSFTLTIGSSIFTFEGIGLILPIQSSMKRPECFDGLLYAVMSVITVLFTAVGALSYATFGSETKTEILSNFPQTSRLVNTVQFLYSLAILVGTPIQLFPAVRIIEGRLFGPVSGKRDPWIKWKKNVFRTVAVLGCGLLSAVGAGDLDKFVSLIGSFACVPLVYIYPAYLHWKGIAESPWAKRGDLAMIVLGFVFMIYTTAATVSVWMLGK
ncbi:hypothetical protein AOCH_001989 [Aspergillus ochraceoroseus]|uniref:Amino acid transporter transmembrane domain-containing protein n=1 Tax=Aspergillus ochraceoroseus TaxID=138278 RepID=A0A0F8VGM6_9EURO|nr:hypothetical protein AOCH_001989 [Aspergillus ochraceoroseus]